MRSNARTKRSTVEIIGCGGVGGHLAPNLCRFLHAERRATHVVLVDGDAFEERNRGRMRFTRPENKAMALARELAAAFGDLLSIEPVPEYVTAANVDALIGRGDLVLLAVDNHATRRLVDLRCAAIRDVALVSGGNDGVEDGHDGTYGNVQVLVRTRGRARTNSLGTLHPEISHPRDRLPSELSCTELAQAGAPQLLFTNLAVASAMLNAVYRLLRGELDYEEVFIDIRQNRVSPIRRAPP